MRWIVEIGTKQVLWHRVPFIRIKRAPYSGQQVFDRGWGWRRLVGCKTCSGVGYVDVSEAEWEFERDLFAAMDESPERVVEVLRRHPASVELNQAVDARTITIGTNTFVDCGEELLRAPETPGLYRLVADEEGRRFVPQQPAQGQHGPVYTEDTYREMAVEDGDISRWDGEGGNGHNRG